MLVILRNKKYKNDEKADPTMTRMIISIRAF